MKLLAALLIASLSLLADPLKKNEILKVTEFTDQFERPLIITKDTQKIIISFSKANGAAVKDFLYANRDYLAKNSAVYLADVSSVPGFVMSMFMLPKFEEYYFKMGLIEDEKKALYFPRKDDKLTIIHMTDLMVKEIEFRDNL